MNTINTFQTIYYKRSSRTIETVMVSNGNERKKIYVYNYEGYSFRVFETRKEVSNFFNLNIESKFHFNNEESLDNFLINLNIS
jgi:hypothetical protein